MSLIEDALARVQQARERRVEAQVARVDRLRNTPRPAAYGGAGRVLRLGADGSWRPSSNQLAGGVPIGGPIGYVAGVASSQPTIGGARVTGQVDIANIEESLRRIGGLLGGILTDEDDPNEAEIAPRHNRDVLGSTTSGIWIWDPVLLEWVPIAAGGGGDPVGYVNIQYPRADVFPVMSPALEALEIVSITSSFQVGSGTFQWNYAVGQTVPLGGTLSVTLSNLSTDNSQDPPLITARRFVAAIEFARPTPPPP